MKQRIAITGAGLICPGATSADALWQQTVGARQEVSWLSLPRNFSVAGRLIPVLQVRHNVIVSPEGFRVRRMRSADRTLQLAIAAAAHAWKDAGFAPPDDKDGAQSGPDVAVVVGTSRGPLEKICMLASGQPGKPAPRLPSDSAYSSLHGTVSSMIAAKGPAFSVSTACASGAHAVILAADQIRTGRVPVALAGAADAPLHPALVHAMRETGILDVGALQPVCRPFSRDRSGTILGEAAAFLVLEDEEHARRRNARIRGFLCGAGMASDGEITSPEAAGGEALCCAVRRALEDAVCDPSEIGYVNVHGTGTVLNDAMECDWLLSFRKERGLPVPFSSTKPVTGHCLGATAVLEMIICLEAMRHKILPPSANCREPMPEALPGIVLSADVAWDGNCALSNSVGFWGSAASVVLRSAESACRI